MLNRFFPEAPGLRQLPRALLNAAVFGALVGPPFSLFLAWLMRAPWERVFARPLYWLLGTTGVGVIFSLAFYVSCGLPLGYVRRRLIAAPACYARLITSLTGLGGGMLGCIIAFAAMRWVFGSGIRMAIPLLQIVVIDGIIAMAVGLALNAWARLQAEKELTVARAHTKALQAQINPHFFFNSLNTISALIATDPDEAQRTVGLLSNMSRYAFSTAQAEAVPLAREIEFARCYLEIEKARFRDRLHFELPDATAAGDISVPSLTLQPLAENSVRHGIAHRVEGGSVMVRLNRNETHYSLVVENEVDCDAEVSEVTFFREGHALANVRNRLRLAYKGQASIEVRACAPNIVVVTIHAPIRPCLPAA
ncbi:MAG: histidine kinase [Bryobacteraceae bacterium]